VKLDFQTAREEFLALMDALEEEPHHVLHVATLAVHLFDELEDLHGLGDHDRLLLEGAALLHDIGWSAAPSGKGHHRESARLIREHGWKNLGAEAVNLLAQVARYHRKSVPDLEHEDFAALAPAERLRVQTLAAHLRIADGLDRSHQQRITHLSAEITPGQIVIHLSTHRPVSREVAAATRKADLARSIFQREVTFALPPGSLDRLS
jgi:exopolyphosphatase/guanosine-5'-triphosphate,3'-diphosphate pyrophosphatase